MDRLKPACFLIFLLIIPGCDAPTGDIDAVLAQTSHLETIPVEEELTKRTEGLICILTMESLPEFPGGNSAWRAYLNQHFRPPAKFDTSGYIAVHLTVTETGDLQNISILRGLHPEANQYVLDFMRNSPDWIPLKRAGKSVASTMTIMLRFNE